MSNDPDLEPPRYEIIEAPHGYCAIYDHDDEETLPGVFTFRAEAVEHVTQLNRKGPRR
jgi:hypothetical protein